MRYIFVTFLETVFMRNIGRKSGKSFKEIKKRFGVLGLPPSTLRKLKK